MSPKEKIVAVQLTQTTVAIKLIVVNAAETDEQICRAALDYWPIQRALPGVVVDDKTTARVLGELPKPETGS